ncbi:MAG TPA: hypothetical protein VH640_14955 [Bryobacteraceae bacterium]|jgi:hypothetical protein
MIRAAVRISLLLPSVLPIAAQPDYCGLLQQSGAVGTRPASGLRPLSTVADDIVQEIGKYAPFTTTNFFLFGDSRNPDLRQQGAAAQICNGNERYIFYNTDFVDNIRKQGGNDWPKYFTFAHEIAHHINGDTLLHHESNNVELAADHSAATWLTRRGASLQEIRQAINALGLNEQPRAGYPSRCQRLAEATFGYDDAARDYNEHGGRLPVYENCGCIAVEAGGGLYARGGIRPRTALKPVDVMSCGSTASGANLPFDFSHDLQGMCPVVALHEGDRLTWNNIGVCSLMH